MRMTPAISFLPNIETTPWQRIACPWGGEPSRWLALGVLGGFAGALEAGLLALLHAGVAGQHAVFLQHRPHRQVGRTERPGDTVLDRTGLAGHSAAVHHGADVEALLALGQL